LSVLKLDREKALSVAALFILVLACILAPALTLNARSGASQDLADEQEMLARLEAAHQRSGPKPAPGAEMGTAPDTAFLNAQTSGLAGAQFEAYLSQLALAQQASVISSGVQQANHADAPEIVRIQAMLDIHYDALQTLLYQLETGTPYVFVDSLTLQPPSAASQHDAHDSIMKVTLNLSALWHQTQP
jgi:general secretion pathway protein M